LTSKVRSFNPQLLNSNVVVRADAMDEQPSELKVTDFFAGKSRVRTGAAVDLSSLEGLRASQRDETEELPTETAGAGLVGEDGGGGWEWEMQQPVERGVGLWWVLSAGSLIAFTVVAMDIFRAV
jgi:hypothetical protein